ncbi:uncharacterized protein LOC134536664 isoform X2 [Bacillus rossius redtenbacheri]
MATKGEELWWSLYDAPVVEFCSQQEPDLQGISALLGVTSSCYKRLRAQYINTKHECELMKNRLQVTLSDLNRIECELKSKTEKPCERCKVLENELDAQKKKSLLNEERMRSIARILNVGSTQKLPSDGDGANQSQLAYAYSVVTQILHDESPSLGDQKAVQNKVDENVPGKQEEVAGGAQIVSSESKPRTDTLTFKCFDNMTLVPETLAPEKPRVNVIIPETLAEEDDDNADDFRNIESDKQVTPKKQLIKVKITKENRSPVIGRASNRTPTKAGDAGPSETPRGAPPAEDKSPSLLKEDEPRGPCGRRAGTWVLKPSNEATSSARGGKPPARRLTQAKLSLARRPSRVDVCSTQEFSGGVRHTSTLAVPGQPDGFDHVLQKVLQESLEDHQRMQENEDMVLESPDSSSAKSLHSSLGASHGRSRAAGRLEVPKRSGDPDETFFPAAGGGDVKRVRAGSSQTTQELLAELGMAAPAGPGLGVEPLATPAPDRVPDKERTKGSPSYIYQRDAVRGKAARSRLKGWSCHDCKALYEGLHLTEAEKKRLMNECSRHRDKFPVRSTSPTDW